MSLNHLILGLLHDAPASGYDLNKRIEMTIAHFWQADHTQIYRALHTLEQSGWVTVETIVQQDAPNKKIYQITPTGLTELHRWLATPQHEKVHEAWIGKLFFGDLLSTTELTILFEHRMRHILAALKVLYEIDLQIKTHLAKVNHTRQIACRTLSRHYATAMLEAELAWLQQTLEDIQLFDEKFATDQSDDT